MNGKEYVKEVENQIENEIKKFEGELSPEELTKLKETLEKLLLDGFSIKEVMGITPEMTETIYKMGFQFYTSGNYQKALSVFNLMKNLDDSDPRVFFALAATHHQMKNYTVAIGYYMISESLDKTNPFPCYYLSDCFLHIGQPEMAVNSLSVGCEIAGENPKYLALKNKMEALKLSLQAKEKNTLEAPKETKVA